MAGTKSIYLNDQELADAKKRADETEGGNFNAYVLGLLRADREGRVIREGSAVLKGEEPIIGIAGLCNPVIAQELAELINRLGINQPQLASAMIRALWGELKRLWLDARREPKDLELVREFFENDISMSLRLIVDGHVLQGRIAGIAEFMETPMPQAQIDAPTVKIRGAESIRSGASAQTGKPVRRRRDSKSA